MYDDCSPVDRLKAREAVVFGAQDNCCALGDGSLCNRVVLGTVRQTVAQATRCETGLSDCRGTERDIVSENET